VAYESAAAAGRNNTKTFGDGKIATIIKNNIIPGLVKHIF